MSTIWEMAGAIRAEEELALRTCPTRAIGSRNPTVEIGQPGAVEFWCKFFGTTPMNLCCAIEEVGHEPTAVRRFLNTRGRAQVA